MRMVTLLGLHMDRHGYRPMELGFKAWLKVAQAQVGALWGVGVGVG